MTQMTVKQLYLELAEEIKKGNGDKFIIAADDNEFNSFHGLYYGISYSDPEDVAEQIECSNGVYDSQVEDPDKLVILG